jgi:hypothetical protein
MGGDEDLRHVSLFETQQTRGLLIIRCLLDLACLLNTKYPIVGNGAKSLPSRRLDGRMLLLLSLVVKQTVETINSPLLPYSNSNAYAQGIFARNWSSASTWFILQIFRSAK